jgi:hypothetical protein
VKRAFLAILVGICVACAVMEPPSGGPEDKIPPRIVAISPEPASAGIPRDSGVEILFSEKLDGDSFKNRVFTYPSLEFKSIKVKGDRLTVEFSEFLPETTVTVLLKAGYQDDHMVKSTEHVTFSFSTSDTIDAGTIAGRILFKRQPDSTGVAKIFAVAADSAVDVNRTRESRIAFTDKRGYFTFRAIPTDSTPFILWVFSDKNGDGDFAVGSEFSALFPDTIALNGAQTVVDGILINIIDPDEPGTVEGRIVNLTGLSKTPTVKLAPLMPGERPIVVTADSTGNFVIAPIPPGGYTVTAFIDMKADSMCGEYESPADSTVILTEPCYIGSDTLVVKPGESRTIQPITLEEKGR